MGKLPVQLGRVIGGRESWVFCSLLLVTTLLGGCNSTSAPSTASNAGSTASAASVASATSSGTAPSVSVNPATTNKSADVSWTAPTRTVGGSALTNLAGYHVYYGTNPYYLTKEIDVPNPGTLDQVVTGLSSGTWYFAVAAYTNAGLESCMSIIQGKTIT